MQIQKVCTLPNKSKRKYADALICIVFLIILLLFSRAPIEIVRSSLSLCYRTVIPSVFPFMVISSFMIRSNMHLSLSSLLGKPIRAIFGCSERAAVSVILGFLSGFPIGASSAVTLYDNGEISKSELERLLVFINNPGSAFVIGGVGLGIFNSTQVGRILYFSVIISSVLAGIISRIFLKKEVDPPSFYTKPTEAPSFASAFTTAVSDSAFNMLTVCACVVFFSVPVGIISKILAPLGFSSEMRAILSSFFEISGGCGSVSALPSPKIALMVCAFASSWSGLSVHLQVFSVCRGRNISFTPYLTSKLLQGLVSPFIALCLSRFASELTFAQSDSPISATPLAQKVISIFFFISIAVLLTKGRKRSYNKNERRCIP